MTLEAAWRGDGASIDASVVDPAPATPFVGEDAEVSDLTAMSSPRPMEAEVVVDSEPKPTESDKEEPVVEKVVDEESVDEAMSSRPSSPFKEGMEVSRPTSPFNNSDVPQISRPSTPGSKDKESDSESGAVSTTTKGSRSPSRVLQSASTVYTSAYSRSNSTVPKVHQFFLNGVSKVRLPAGKDGVVVAVYEDEPTSVIAYAITSNEYHTQLDEAIVSTPAEPEGNTPALDNVDEILRSSTPPLERPGSAIGKALTAHAPLTVKVRFSDVNEISKTEYQVVCYYTKQFLALRAKCCGGEMEYIRSLSRCKKWGAQGGKSKAYFAKTLDDRFIVKQVSSTEKYSFLEFAPQYFKHLWEMMSSRSPTCLAKIVGFYTVTVKKGGKEKEMDMMVMENLVYGKNYTRMYDLKGSQRSRYNPDATGTLLDENLLEDKPTSPIFMTNKEKHTLERAVYNDTSFLAKVHVMDYSLLAVVLEDRQELVIGIIDYIRQYTWDKHLETWVKASGILGGSKNTTPTVVSPKEYKKRFRKEISGYFVVVPESEAPPLLRLGLQAPATDATDAADAPALPGSDSSCSLVELGTEDSTVTGEE